MFAVFISTSWYLMCFFRLPLEALTDKEPGQMELDSEEEEEKEEEGQAVEALPASQTQPTTSEVNMEEEDLLIEEYYSD